MSDDDLRKKIKPFLVKAANHDEVVVDEFLQRVHYRYGIQKHYQKQSNPCLSDHEYLLGWNITVWFVFVQVALST